MPQPDRPRIGDHAESRNRRQQQRAADPHQRHGRFGLRDARDDLRVMRGENQRQGQRHHPQAAQQAGDVLRPLSLFVVLGEEPESVEDQTRNDKEVGACSNCQPEIHGCMDADEQQQVGKQ